MSQAITPTLSLYSGLPCKQAKPHLHLSGIKNRQARALQSNVSKGFFLSCSGFCFFSPKGVVQLGHTQLECEGSFTGLHHAGVETKLR